IRIERLLHHPQEEVWRALTDPQVLGSWLMENNFEPKLHHRFMFRMKPQRGWDGLTHCEVIELESPHRLAFTYRGEATGEKTLSCAGIHSGAANAAAKGIFTQLDTVLRFTLEPDRLCDGTERTRLRLEHSGFNGFKLTLVSFVMGMGWKKILRRLEA